MNKKVYCQPQTEEIRIEPATMLASSLEDYDGTLNARWTPDIFDDEEEWWFD